MSPDEVSGRPYLRLLALIREVRRTLDDPGMEQDALAVTGEDNHPTTLCDLDYLSYTFELLPFDGCVNVALLACVREVDVIVTARTPEPVIAGE